MQSLPQQQVFEPVRRRGLLINIGAAVILVVISASSVWAAVQWGRGNIFVLLMILALVSLAFLPVILYRAYALINARYILERDGVRIRWGLRSEDIPLTEVEWVRPVNESGYSVNMPVFSWPGAILGSRNIAGLGEVEFIASESSTLLLIATTEKVYAISPLDMRFFETSFQRTLEMGSLSPISARSAKPIAFLQTIWQNRLARILLILNLALVIVLWLVSGFVIANHQILPLGYNTQGLPLDFVPAEQLLLLPVINTFVWVGDSILGLIFSRRLDETIVAYFVWIGGVLTSILLILAVFLFAAAGS